MCRTTLSCIIGFLSTITLSSFAISAELRPLNLPSAQRQAAPPQQQAQQVIQIRQPTVFDRFRDQVDGLNEQQKEEYRQSYQASLSNAELSGEQDAANYYRELLKILN